MDKFWVCSFSNFGPNEYPNIEDAKREAERLARKYKRKVYVLELAASCEVVEPVKWES